MTKVSQTRFTLKDVNAAIADKGLELLKGEGYFYFYSDTRVELPRSVYVSKLRDLKFDQWLEAADVEKKAKGQSIGALVNYCIAAGMTNDEILQQIRYDFPNAKTSKGSLAWYRCKLKKKAS